MSSQAGSGGQGSHKHGVSGHVHTTDHFTGKQGKSGKRKRLSTRKSRRQKHDSHVNKYAQEP